MKHIYSLLLSLVLSTPMLARADSGLSQFTDLDSFVKNSKVSFVGECVPIDETNASGFVFVRKMLVISVLQGAYAPGKVVTVLARTSLVPGRYYLICGNENTRGELGTWSLEEGEIEIQVLPSETKGQREAQLAGVIKGLEGKPFKEQLQIIFKRRLEQLKTEAEKTKREMEVLEKALKPSDDTQTRH